VRDGSLSGRAHGNVAGRAGAAVRGATGLWLLGVAASAAAGTALPTVASINLCADQLVLSLAEPAQILTLSWLAADPEESMLAAAAAPYPRNYGSTEEILRFDPDVVIAGVYTNGFASGLLKRLGVPVLELAPATTIADIERNLRLVGGAIGRERRATEVVTAMHAMMRRIEAARPARPRAAIVVRPGGFTVGEHSLADTLMKLAGLTNIAAEHGLDRWGSLSMETLLTSRPDLVILTPYHASEPSLANAVLQHPALTGEEARHETTAVRAAYWACGLPQSLESSAALERAAKAAP
jgi:iron complex transport system substrate-binding protein